jgi:hypothetical protein
VARRWVADAGDGDGEGDAGKGEEEVRWGVKGDFPVDEVVDEGEEVEIERAGPARGVGEVV